MVRLLFKTYTHLEYTFSNHFFIVIGSVDSGAQGVQQQTGDPMSFENKTNWQMLLPPWEFYERLESGSTLPRFPTILLVSNATLMEARGMAAQAAASLYVWPQGLGNGSIASIHISIAISDDAVSTSLDAELLAAEQCILAVYKLLTEQDITVVDGRVSVESFHGFDGHTPNIKSTTGSSRTPTIRPSAVKPTRH